MASDAAEVQVEGDAFGSLSVASAVDDVRPPTSYAEELGIETALEEPAELLHDRAQVLWQEGIAKFEGAQFETAEEMFKRTAELHKQGVKAVFGKSMPPAAGDVVDTLAHAYRHHGLDSQAEALYLQMLLWHEATQHFNAENFAASNTLFAFSSYFATIAEASAFLDTLQSRESERPSVHKVEPCLVLLCCDAALAGRALAVILRLLGSDDTKPDADAIDALVHAGAIELIFTAAETHAHDPALITEAFGALRRLVPLETPHRPRMVFWLRQHQAVSWAAGRLNAYQDDAGVQKQGCLFLACVAHGDMGVQQELLQLGAVHSILDLPERMPSTGAAAVELLIILLSAPAWMDPLVEQSQEDALKFYLRVMHLKPDRLPVAYAALEVVKQHGSTKQTLNGNSRHELLVQENAVSRIISTLQPSARGAPPPLKLVVGALEVLWGMTSEYNDFCRDFAEMDGIPLLAHAMDTHLQKLEVQRASAGLIRNTAFDHEGRKSIFVRNGFVERLLAALRMFSKDPRLPEEVFAALKNVVSSAPFALVRCKGLQAVLSVLAKGNLTDAAWVQGAHLLGIYTTAPELIREMQSVGAAEILKNLPLPAIGSVPGPYYGELLRQLTGGK
jgi:hypothetical protein